MSRLARNLQKNAHQTRARDEGAHKKWVEGKNGQTRVFIGLRNTSRFVAVKDPFTAAKPYYAAAKRASLLLTRGLATRLFSLRNSVASFSAADQKAEIFFFFPSAATKQASLRRTKKSRKLCFCPLPLILTSLLKISTSRTPKTKILPQSNKKEWKYASFMEKENLTKLGLPPKKRYV